MPDSSKIRNLIDALKREYLSRSMEKRRSPLGVDEYIVPWRNSDEVLGVGTHGITSNYLGGNKEPYIMYNEAMANNPDTMTHERIHAGQRLLPNKPSGLDVINSLPVYPGDIESYSQPEAEYPARRFSTAYRDFPEQQGEFNRYLDMMRSINPQGIQTLEAAMPTELIREYIKSHARPLSGPAIPGLTRSK